MKVKLSELKPSQERVRKNLNLDKLDELAQSIKETGGVIVPIKVRKNGDGYRIVYGHRRVEACKLAGLKEIEAFVSETPDDQMLTEGLIENVVREDMDPLDIAKALDQVIKETGWSHRETAQKFGWADHRSVGRLLEMLEPDVKAVVEKGGGLTPQHLKEAKAGTEDDKDMVKVLEKASKEGLSTRQTRTVAEAVKDAKSFGGEKAAETILSTPFEKLGLEQYKPVTKPTKRTRQVVTPPKEVTKVFSWVRDPNVVRAEAILQGVQADLENVKAVVAYMETNVKREPGALKQIGVNLMRMLEARSKQLRDIKADLVEVISQAEKEAK